MVSARLPPRAPARGYALVLALLMVVAVALASTAAVLRWQTEMQRERERQLRFAGTQYAQAIARYVMAVPTAQQYPRSLDDLLEDRRFPMPRRHLRRRYVDPMTGQDDWVLIQQDGRIVGLHSRSTAATLKQEGGTPSTYADWQFVAAVTVQGKVGNTTGGTPTTPTTPVTPTVPADPPVVTPTAPSTPEAPQSCYIQYMEAVTACNQLGTGREDQISCRAQAGRAMRDCRRAHPN